MVKREVKVRHDIWDCGQKVKSESYFSVFLGGYGVNSGGFEGLLFGNREVRDKDRVFEGRKEKFMMRNGENVGVRRDLYFLNEFLEDL